MKFKIVSIGILTVFYGCRKDDDSKSTVVPSPAPVAYISNSPGSYNLYNWRVIDNFGQETFLSVKDSTYVVGDTLINGKEYVHIGGTYFGAPTDWYFRDSSNYIVDNLGNIQWTKEVLEDTLATVYSPNGDDLIYTIFEPESSFDFPEGLLKGELVQGYQGQAYDLQSHYYNLDGTYFTACDSVWIRRKLFADGIGEVMSQTALLGDLQTNCKYLERRLVYYKISN